MKTTEIKIGNYTYTFEYGESQRFPGQPTLKCIRKFKATKALFFYRYESMEKLEAAKAKFIQAIHDRETQREQDKIDRKMIKRADKQKQLEEYKVGAIFVNNWGYDQTNVDAYQIIEREGIKVRFKPIALETVPGSEGRDCCNVKPVKDAFIEKSWKMEEGQEYFEKQLRGQYAFFDFGSQEIWDGKRSYYNSWYA